MTDQRRALYDQGLTDKQISERTGINRSTLADWRRRHGLPAHNSPHNHTTNDKSGHYAAFARLYAAGMSDTAIGKDQGVSISTVLRWRRRNNLPRNHHPDDDARRLEIYEAGLPDCRAAEILGMNVRAYGKWRKRRDLAAVADARTIRYLFVEKVERKAKPPLPPAINPIKKVALWRRIDAAIPRWPAEDIREDAASEMLLALVAGDLAEHDIERMARRYLSRVVNAFSSRWGPASLDEHRGETDASLYDFLPCQNQASNVRVIELSALARLMGIDVNAVLSR